MGHVRTGSYYNEQGYEVARNYAKEARAIRRAMKDADVDTLVGTGLSGALAIPTLARALGVEYVIIRKDGDSNHSRFAMEGKLGHRWAFVDDFISAGETRTKVIEKVEAEARRRGQATQYVGDYLYRDRKWYPGKLGGSKDADFEGTASGAASNLARRMSRSNPTWAARS